MGTEDYLMHMAHDAWSEQTKNLLDDNIKSQSGDSIIDMGAGVGILSEYMASKGASVTALDYSKDRLQQSIDKIRRLDINLKINYIVADMRKTELPDKSFDKALFFDSLHHVEDTENAIKEVYRILKPGGILVLHEPNKRNPFRKGNEIIHMGTETEVSFRIEDLKELLIKNGFEIEKADCTVFEYVPIWDNEKWFGSSIRSIIFPLLKVFPEIFGVIIIIARKSKR